MSGIGEDPPGAYVIGAAGGPAKVEAVRNLGADLAVDYRSSEWVAAGTLVPLVHHFPLADAARVHRALESRGTVGKVVLVP